MWLVLGLGNPGPEYQGTRHNVGFAVVDLLAGRHGVALNRTRHRARFGQGELAGCRAILAQPLTFMNLSGEAARPLMSFHGVPNERLVVVHDEADLEPGTVRLKWGGGNAGHKGLASLTAHLGGPEFFRVRVGIGRPTGGGAELVDFVLDRPGPQEAAGIREGVEKAALAVEILLGEGLEAARRAIHQK